MKTLLPDLRAWPCSGRAIRLPKPPAGKTSWLGKNLSYDLKPISLRVSIVSVRMSAPSARASRAGIGSEKKIQTWPPSPERERSSAAGMPLVRHVCMKARESSAQCSPSKSAARNEQRSSASIGYTPATNSAPRREVHVPRKCFSITSFVTRSKAWLGQALHLICGLRQRPATHSLLQAGE
jgi:hypothetical protein